MEVKPFLIVDDQPINIDKAVQYLKSSGNLGNVVRDIVQQYVIEQELQSRTDIEVNPSAIQQAEINFRLQNQLTDLKAFEDWLVKNGINYDTFHKQVTSGFKLARLKAQISEPKLQEYFIQRQLFLDRVVLSRIVVDKQEDAEQLYSRIKQGERFEQLAKEHSIAEEKLVNGMMGAIRRGTLPDQIRSVIDSAKPGDILAPIQIDKQWYLFRVEEFLPASLSDPQTRETLQNELFNQWLMEKMQKMNIKLGSG